MKVLITGATGFVGKALLKRLDQKGYDIAVLTRNPEAASFHLPVHCEVYSWNPDSDSMPTSAFNNVNAVINLAGENIADGWWTDKRKQKILESRTSSVKLLNQSMKALNQKPDVFVSASAIGFYGDSGSNLVDENSNVGSGFLSEVCQAWENEIFKIKDLGVRTVAYRIGMVLGHDGGALKRMLPPFKLGFGGRLGHGRQWMSWVHIDDLVEMIVYAIENPSVEGPVNAVSPNPVNNSDFTKILGRVLQRPVLIPVPRFALELGLGDLSHLLLDSQRVDSNKILKYGFKFKYPILDDALREICSHPYHELQMEQWIPHEKEKAFAFFKEAKNLEKITPEFLGFKILRQSTEKIEEGTTFDYRLRLGLIPMWWRSKITDWEPGSRFSDIQVRGPYSYWYHTHEFQEKDGGTLMRDIVKYKLPFGVPGDVIAEPFVRKDIEKIFNHRRKVIDSMFN